MVRIPSEYQEVEYLESNAAYIDFPVNIQVNDSFRAEIKFQYLGTKTKNYWLAGDGLSENGYRFEFGMFGRWYHSGDTAIYTVVSGSSHNAVIEASQEKNYTANVNLTFRICQRHGFTAETDGRRVYYTRLFLNSSLLVNFIPCYRKSDNEIGMYDTVSKTFFTNQGTGTFLKGNDVNYDTVNLMESRRRILLNTPHFESLTGSILSFKTDMASKLKECKIHFTPIQEGSGDPSPENVRPITGWDGVTVTRCGKNLFANQKGSKSYIGLKAGVTYTISYRADSNAYFRGINENGSYITNIIWMNTGVINERRYGRITPSIDIPYGVIFRSAGLSEAQIEVGSEATSYEPYESTTLTIPFPQTIYGGYVDLVKGEVVEEWEKITLDGVTTNRKVNRDYTNTVSLACGVVYLNPSGKEDNSRVTKLLCENMTIVASSQTAEYPYIRTISSGRQYLRIFMGPIGDYPDLDTAQKRIDYINSYLSENPTAVCYPLRNQNAYPLDPVAIRTLKGLNNIWSDANGNIELKFWTH